MKKIILTAMATIISALALGTSASAASSSLPPYARLRHISFAGTGCPAGSVAGLFDADVTAFRVYFDDFVAQTGPGLPMSEKRKNCQLSIDFDIPAGWSFSVASMEYRGFVDLDAGVTAQQTSTYYFQGAAQTARLSTTINGPIARSYDIKDTLAIEGQVWSPCGLNRALNVNAQVLVNSTSSRREGIITLDRLDARVAHIFGLQWRRCN
jgi:hypothetical protein